MRPRVYAPLVALLGALSLLAAPPAQAQSTDATLSALKIYKTDSNQPDNTNSVPYTGDAYTLTPAFEAGVYLYRMRVPDDVRFVVAVATPTAAAVTSIVVSGNRYTATKARAPKTTVTSGEASGPWEAFVGYMMIQITVTAEDGNATAKYKVIVERGTVDDPTGMAVTPKDGSLTVTWDENTASTAPDRYFVRWREAGTTTWLNDGTLGSWRTDYGDNPYPPYGAAVDGLLLRNDAFQAREYEITELTDGTEYEVELRGTRGGSSSHRGDSDASVTNWLKSPWVTVRGAPGTPPVSLSAAPNPVPEGSAVTVTATLSSALTSDVTIPLTLTDDTAESGDHGTLASITVVAGATSGTGTIATYQDNEDADETFTVALGTLPSSVIAGDPSSVQIEIKDDDVAVWLEVSPNPVPEGTSVAVEAYMRHRPVGGVVIPVILRHDTSEGADWGNVRYRDEPRRRFISVHPWVQNLSTGLINISTHLDGDTDDETFIVALDTANLPAGYVAGTPSSVTVTITDDGIAHLRHLPPPPPPTDTDDTDDTGGGGTRTPTDRHGDTPAAATCLTPRRYTTGVISRRMNAHLQSRRDVDYFCLDLPSAGILTAATTGGTDTTGRLYQAQAEGAPRLVAEDTDRGPGRNFALGAAVEADTYYLAVSAGRGSGAYTLTVHYTPAFVENPAPASPQSGINVLSGWVCDADTVEIAFETPGGDLHTFVPATGTARADTAVACGAATTATGFGLLFNWNLLGDGGHTVRVLINDVVFAEREITVTTLGAHEDQEFRRGLAATSDLPDFPAAGATTTLRWEEALQNFVIAAGERMRGGARLTPEQAWLENPAPGSFQSGIGVLSGWVCEADTVEIVFEPGDTDETLTFEAGAGTERADTADRCGDSDTGFGLLFNWNLLGDGTHTVRALADGEEFAHSTVTVTTLGAEFAEGLHRTHEIEDFPAEGQTTTVEWQEGQQNFVITGVE